MVRKFLTATAFLVFLTGISLSKNFPTSFKHKIHNKYATSTESRTLNTLVSCDFSVNAGFDVITCESTSVQLSGEVSLAGCDLTWSTSSGLGVFSDPTALDPVFTPDPLDNGETITLRLTANHDGDCERFDELTFTIFSIPVVDAGEDITVCEGETFLLDGQVDQEGYDIEWEGGFGLFSDIFSAQTTYTPSTFDSNPLVLTLTATDPFGTCAKVRSDIIITFESLPLVSAGSNELICEGSSFDLSTSSLPPSAEGFTNLNWTHDGSGVIENPNNLTPVYIPGESDEIVTLTLEASTDGSCVAVSSMELEFQPKPIVETVSEIVICEGSTLDLQAEDLNVQNGVQYIWTTEASGTFDDPNQMLPSFTHGLDDIGNTVVLNIEVIGSDFCESASGQIMVTIERTPIVDAGSDESVEAGSSIDLSLSGNTPFAENFQELLWTTDGNGTFDDPTKLLPIYTPDSEEEGITTLTLTAQGSASCSPQSDNMELEVLPLVTSVRNNILKDFNYFFDFQSQELRIEINKPLIEAKKWSIIDLSGRSHMRGDLPELNGKWSISTQGLTSGIYLFHFDGNPNAYRFLVR